jgi:hypothetical protein
MTVELGVTVEGSGVVINLFGLVAGNTADVVVDRLESWL